MTSFLDRRFLTVAAVALVLCAQATAVAPEIKDEGKFFSPEAIKKANDAIKELARKTGKDLLVETFAAAPADQLEKVKAMKVEDRQKFFQTWALKRADDAVVNGVYILVCKDPTFLMVEVSEKAKSTFDQTSFRKLEQLLLDSFRQKKFDDGLQDAVRFVREKLGAREPARTTDLNR